MQSGSQAASVSKAQLRTGRIMSGLPAMFMLVDGVMKLVKPEVVITGTVELGYAAVGRTAVLRDDRLRALLPLCK